MFSSEFAFLSFHKLYIHMHMLKMTSERNSSLGVSSCGLKWENETYKLKRSIVHIFAALGPSPSKVCPEVRHLFIL